jgi:CO/xanthine dehydrogenase FAD-binding subunit
MKPAPFRYVAPTSVGEAISALTEYGYEAKLLAGGQSLIPAMNFRLSQPGVLVDLNRISSLGYITPTPAGGLRIGAMTRQRQVEQSALIAERAPLLAAAMPHIAHVQIRNRGTIGGSLAHADPAAELPAVISALGGTLVVEGPKGVRRITSDDFYVGLFATDLAADEVLTEIELPPQAARSGFAIQEITRRHGDYALVGIAVQVEVDEAGTCRGAKMVYFSVGEGPFLASNASAMLIGEKPTGALIESAAHDAAMKDLEPPSDIHASALYRRHLALVLGRRALTEAFGRRNDLFGLQILK